MSKPELLTPDQINQVMGEYKSYKFGHLDGLKEKLRNRGFYDLLPTFFDFFLNQISDKEKIAIDINLSWEMAKEIKAKNLGVPSRAALEYTYPEVIKAIIDEPEVVTQVIKLRELILGRALDY